jgi:hypothetical protein
MKIKFSMIPLTLLVAFLFISILSSKAQLPGVGIFFQAIARDKMENPAKDRKIYVQTSIVPSINNSAPILTELHVTKSNDMGVFSLSIGQGNRTGGTASNLSTIAWGNGPLFLNVKIAIEPVSPLTNWDYTKEWIDLGTSPFGTVPYALYAGNAANTNNDNKLNISDTSIMLAPYAKAVATIINNPITPLVVLDSVNQKILQKVNIKDSNLVYVTPFQLSLKTFDTSSLSNRINSKLNTSDTIYISNRINTKLNNTDTAYMLRNYAKTNSFSTLAFSGNYADLINKPAVVANIVNTVNGLTGDVLVNKTTMGIANVDNTTDANKPISILTNSALNNKVDKAAINAANGIPSLDANTKIPSYLLPAISFTSVTIANSAAQMQAIGTTALKGTVAVRTDISKTYILSIDKSSNVNDWVEILNPGAPVQSVNGKLANVSLTTSDITEGSNEYFTQSKARLSLTANGPINYNSVNGLLSADTSTSNYSLVTRYALQQQNISTIASLNGKVNLIDTANMLYPYSRTIGIKKYIDSVAIVLNSNIVTSNGAIVFPDASASTKGMVQLVGDLGGTATAPIIANNVINTAKIMDGAIATNKVIDAAITDSKIATGISASKVGLSNVNNTSDLNKPISTLAQNAFNLKLNTSDTAAMLNAYLTSNQNLNASKLNKTDTSAMLHAYLTSIQALGTNKLNLSDTAAMLNAYLTSLNYKEIASNKSNDATLGGSSPSATLFPTQSAVKQYIINNTVSGSISATSITGVVAIANGGTGQTTANAAFNALAPSQTSNSGKYLTTNGTNTSWLSVVTPWSVLGNAGMVDGTNFIGTTDAQPLNFKVNNTTAGRVDASSIIAQTSLGFGAALTTLKSNLYGIKNTAIGYQALNGTSYGKGNTAIGYQALINNTKGTGSTAIGYQALANFNNSDIFNADVSGYNTAIGYQALLGSATISANKGQLNVAIGNQPLFLNDYGQSNIAIGNNNLYNNASGSYNVAIGDWVMTNNLTGSNNVAIGSNSFSANTSGSNNTVIGYNISNSGYPNVTNSTAIGNGSYLTDDNTITLGNNDIIKMITYGSMQTYNTTASTSKRTGSIIAYGGAGIAGDVNIGGYTNISGNITTNGIGTFSNTTASTATSNGALIVTGGTGIGGNLNVGGNSVIAGTTTISGTTTLNSISYGTTPLTNDNSTKLATTAYVKNVIAGISTSTSSSSGWALTGNTGMVDGTNFIGTTDAQPLNFVANNINSGRIDVVALSGQTSFGYGSAVSTLKNTSNFYGTKNTSIGYQTLYNTVYGKENTAIGYQALYNNNTASGSTAIGYQAMYNAYNISTASAYSTSNTAVGYQALLGSSTPANNSGISNTAIGHYAERSNSSGSNNTGIGDLSLYYNTTGQNNTAIGYNTLSSITTGSSNTAIGYNADVTNNVSNATAIGNGATTNTDNTIQLGNGNITNVNTAGVYATSNTTESTNSSSGAIVISGGAGIAKNLNVGGNLSVTEANVKHLKGTSATPTYLLGSGAGNTPTNVSFTGTDLSGNITFKTSSGLMANSSIFNLSYATPYSTAPAVVFSPANAASASLYSGQSVWINSSTSYFSIISGSSGLLNNTTYSWNYIVVQ